MKSNTNDSKKSRSGRRNRRGNRGEHSNGGNQGGNSGSTNQGNKSWKDSRNAPIVNRSLFASAMGSDGFTTVLRSMTSHEVDRVCYDRSINVIDLNAIESFADKAKRVGIEGAVTMLLVETGKIAQQFVIVLNCGVDALKTGLITAVRKAYDDKHESAVGEILSTLRAIDANTVVNHGVWNESKVAARRFLASILYFAFGAEWVKANFSATPVGYEALSLFQERTIAANGFEAHSTIPTLTPTSTLVLGIFPQPNGKVEKRYVGTLPAKPMIRAGNPNQVLPPIIVVDRVGESMQALIKLVETGWADANTMFKNEKGEYFTYTPDMIEIMSKNKLLFTVLLAMAIASTKGNVQLAIAIKERYDAYARAYPSLTSLIAQDYTMTPALPTVTATSKAHVMPSTNGNARSTKTSTPVLATVGAASSSFDPFAPNL